MPLTPRRQLWAQMPTRALMTVLIAVTLTFSTMGFLTDITVMDEQPFSSAVYGGAISGLTAATVLLALARGYLWLLATVAVQMAGTWFLRGPALATPFVFLTDLTQEARLRIDSLAAVFTVISGYTAFIVFIERDAKRQIAMRTELDLATEMHRTLVPRIDTTIGASTFHGVSDPSGQVGGDLVDVIALRDKGWLAYVADVSGHGVSSGLVMGMVKSAVRMAIDDELALPVLAGRLNALLCSQLNPGTYVTMGAMRGHADGQVDVLIAGHPPLLRTRREGHGIEDVATDNIPLGVMADWTFTATSITLAPGDTLVLLTDGLFEVFDRKDRDLGLDSVRAVIAAARAEAPAAIATRVFDRARAFGAQLDDQSILVVRG